MTNWTSKPKIAAASGVLGLLLGAGVGGQTDDGAIAEAKDQSRSLVQKAEASADARVDDAVAEAEEANTAAIDEAVSQAVAAEKAKREKLIASAVTQAVDEVKATAAQPEAAKPKTLVDSKPAATDPRFGTCREANAAGYGNYQRGSDPEYDWYQDRDKDGSVCE